MTTEIERLLIEALAEQSGRLEQIVKQLAAQQTQQSMRLAELSKRVERLTNFLTKE